MTNAEKSLTILKILSQELQRVLYHLIEAEKKLASTEKEVELYRKYEGEVIGFGNNDEQIIRNAKEYVEKCLLTYMQWKDIVEFATEKFITDNI